MIHMMEHLLSCGIEQDLSQSINPSIITGNNLFLRRKTGRYRPLFGLVTSGLLLRYFVNLDAKC